MLWPSRFSWMKRDFANRIYFRGDTFHPSNGQKYFDYIYTLRNNIVYHEREEYCHILYSANWFYLFQWTCLVAHKRNKDTSNIKYMMLRIKEYQCILLMVSLHNMSIARATESNGAGKKGEMTENKLNIFSDKNNSKYIGILTSTINT